MTKVKATPCDASSIHLLILLNSFIVVVEEAFGNQRILIVSLFFFFFNILVLCESQRFDGFVHPFHDSMPIPLSALINLFLLLSFFVSCFNLYFGNHMHCSNENYWLYQLALLLKYSSVTSLSLWLIRLDQLWTNDYLSQLHSLFSALPRARRHLIVLKDRSLFAYPPWHYMLNVGMISHFLAIIMSDIVFPMDMEPRIHDSSPWFIYTLIFYHLIK